MAAILVVDDERSVREMLEVYLGRQRHSVRCAAGLEEGIAALAQGSIDVVLTDLKLGTHSGLAMLDAAKARDASCEVIVMTAFSTIETAVQAMKAGAYDYVQKPFILDEVALLIDRALERRRLVAENVRLRTELGEPGPRALVARSPAMREIVKLIDKVAGVRANVLVTGESGVGKEVVAREIHARGPRKERPFLAVNCGAIPEGLIESELFGHMKGAFTGAVATREGLLAAARDGTLFLDEIGDLPKETQVKLLRVIQERKARPVGSTEDFEVEARLVAATNRDLAAAVAAGRFREDLFYRLNVIHLKVPPLRERREDILPLAEEFLKRQAEIQGRGPFVLAKETAQHLLVYDFPGNVRELENLLERAATLTETLTLGLEIFSGSSARGGRSQGELGSDGVDLDAELQRVERGFILKALERTGGVKVAAASLLGMSFRSFRYRLAKLGLAEGADLEEVPEDPAGAGPEGLERAATRARPERSGGPKREPT
jgi:two-component system response regulator PilR (NtrC family)